MRQKFLVLGLTLATAFILASCSGQPRSTDAIPEKDMESENMGTKADEMVSDVMDDDAMAKDDMSDDEMTDHKDDGMIEEGDEMTSSGESEDKADELMSESTGGSMGEDESDTMSPDWFKEPLTDARSGETFTIADFDGKVVLLETLAMWCSNCLRQQEQVFDLHKLLGDYDNFVSLGIDIDPNENTEALKAYTTKNGFNWRYTVAPVQVAQEIGQLYSSQFLNPPSTPMLIIDGHGEVHVLPFGIKDAETLLEALQPFLEDSI